MYLIKKIAFFYLIFHLIAYSTFLLKFHPKSEKEEKDEYYSDYDRNYHKTYTTTYNYFLIPDYDVVEGCSDCNLKESENFYPFHKFTFAFRRSHYYDRTYYTYRTEGFSGIFGFYGHMEFVFYVIIPLLMFGLSIIYRRYVIGEPKPHHNGDFIPIQEPPHKTDTEFDGGIYGKK